MVYKSENPHFVNSPTLAQSGKEGTFIEAGVLKMDGYIKRIIALQVTDADC